MERRVGKRKDELILLSDGGEGDEGESVMMMKMKKRRRVKNECEDKKSKVNKTIRIKIRRPNGWEGRKERKGKIRKKRVWWGWGVMSGWTGEEERSGQGRTRTKRVRTCVGWLTLKEVRLDRCRAISRTNTSGGFGCLEQRQNLFPGGNFSSEVERIEPSEKKYKSKFGRKQRKERMKGHKSRQMALNTNVCHSLEKYPLSSLHSILIISIIFNATRDRRYNLPIPFLSLKI